MYAAQAGIRHCRVVEPSHSFPLFEGAGLVQVRACSPTPQVTVHVPQLDHPPSTAGPGQGSVLQSCEEGPVQSAPPFSGAGESQARVCSPVPHCREQADHSPQSPSTGQLGTVHGREAGPSQSAPPCCGAGLLQERFCTPTGFAQLDAEQGPQSLQSPSIGQGTEQVCSEGPVQLAPVPEGGGLVQVRVCTPVSLQAVAEQADQSVQSPSTLHTGDVHCRELGPTQSAPPQPRDGLSQVRI